MEGLLDMSRHLKWKKRNLTFCQKGLSRDLSLSCWQVAAAQNIKRRSYELSIVSFIAKIIIFIYNFIHNINITFVRNNCYFF